MKFIELVPQWADFLFAQSAEYLGVLIGPDSHKHAWSNVIKKATTTSLTWKRLNTGFFFNILGSNIFIFSLFHYLGQLLLFDGTIQKILDWHHWLLFGGPGSWLPKLLPVELKQLEDTLQASKVRLAENLPKSFTEDLGVELGRAMLAFRETHEEDDEHYL